MPGMVTSGFCGRGLLCRSAQAAGELRGQVRSRIETDPRLAWEERAWPRRSVRRVHAENAAARYVPKRKNRPLRRPQAKNPVLSH